MQQNLRHPISDAFPPEQRDAVYHAIHSRRDIREFVPGEIPPATLQRILQAAHEAPSVGLSQPWNFIILDDLPLRTRIKESFEKINKKQLESLAGDDREGIYRSLKLEGILESSLNIAITCRADEQKFILGRGPMPGTPLYSTCLAIENLWLAARAEGIGVGWVSILDKQEVGKLLGLPPEIELVAYLCLGHAREFRNRPMLEEKGWKQRETLESVAFHNRWECPFKLPTPPHAKEIPLDGDIAALARKEVDQKTKPLGSLGELERIAVRLAAIQETLHPKVTHKRIVVFAANHGVTQEGISPCPVEITEQMVLNFLRGGAGINVLTRHAGIGIHVVDVGVGANWSDETKNNPRFFDRSVSAGTKNFAVEPAMTVDEVDRALEAGREQVRIALEDGIQLLGIGEMGIGNTTSASAILAATLNIPADEIIGRGAGADDAMLAQKRKVVHQALALHANPNASNPAYHWLRHVGGLEVAAMSGMILEASKQRVPIVIDGFIATASAAAAFGIDPRAKDVCFFSHRSHEKAHALVLEKLGVSALLNLDLRLGEGTGAALAMPIIDAAAKVLCEMATFQSAGVSTNPPR